MVDEDASAEDDACRGMDEITRSSERVLIRLPVDGGGGAVAAAGDVDSES